MTILKTVILIIIGEENISVISVVKLTVAFLHQNLVDHMLNWIFFRSSKTRFFCQLMIIPTLFSLPSFLPSLLEAFLPSL